jgi:hypothetical protein
MKTIKFLVKLFDTEKKQSARMKSDNKIALEIISNLNRQLNQKSDEHQEKITRNSECLAPSEEPVARASTDYGVTFGPLLRLASNGTTSLVG